MKAEYRSAVRSRQAITSAFIDLLQHKPLEAITVTELAAKAQVNRGTFYAHYSGTRDVLARIEDEVIATLVDLIDEFDLDRLRREPRMFAEQMSEFVGRNRDMYARLVGAHGSTLFVEKLRLLFIHRLSGHTGAGRLQPVNVSMLCSGVVGAYQDWLLMADPVPIEAVTEHLARGIAALLRDSPVP